MTTDFVADLLAGWLSALLKAS